MLGVCPDLVFSKHIKIFGWVNQTLPLCVALEHFIAVMGNSVGNCYIFIHSKIISLYELRKSR